MIRIMSWQKLGLVFKPKRDLGWGVSHATAPTAIQLNSGEWRVFFANRDAENRSHVGWFDIDLDDPLKGVKSIDAPLLYPGPTGEFDGNGIYTTGVVRLSNDRIRLYNVGWNPGHKSPLFYAAIGAAESDDMGETIDWRCRAPIMDRSVYDPTSVTGPWVLNEHGRFRMWYVSGLSWAETSEGLKSKYHIKYAESADGLTWKRNGDVAIDFQNESEMNIARPVVLFNGQDYETWFSYSTGLGYCIGYARSTHGIKFERQGDSNRVISSGDFDFESEAVCHPMIVVHKGKKFMFYNGNKFGIDGVALAIES